MASDRVYKIISNYERGALSDASVCGELIDLAGTIGAAAVVPALSAELRSLLKTHSLVADPPTSPEDVFVTEDYCGPGRSAEDLERIERRRRETAHAGAWALHRALYGGNG